MFELPSPARAGGSLNAIEDRSIEVTSQGGGAQPFSRGLAARSLFAAGLEFDRAYRRVEQLQERLRREGTPQLDRRILARRLAELLDEKEGADIAGRYRLIRRLRKLPRPLIFYIGGVGGVGKSTLALDLAPQLKIYRINATDTVRQVMRMVFSPAILPALHVSSYEATPEPASEAFAGPVSPQVLTLEEQAARVCVGVRAVVERAIAENLSLVVEGVHLLPNLVPFNDLEGDAYQFLLVLATEDEEIHRSHFLSRERAPARRSTRQLDHFRVIREQQDHLLGLAQRAGVPILDTANRERTVSAAIALLGQNLSQRLPWLTRAMSASLPEQQLPALLLVIDGLPDPTASFARRTDSSRGGSHTDTRPLGP